MTINLSNNQDKIYELEEHDRVSFQGTDFIFATAGNSITFFSIDPKTNEMDLCDDVKHIRAPDGQSVFTREGFLALLEANQLTIG